MHVQMITVEIHEARVHLDTLIDAVLRGAEVVMTHLGEPVASVHLLDASPDASPAFLRASLLDVVDETLKHLRGCPVPAPWLLN